MTWTEEWAEKSPQIQDWTEELRHATHYHNGPDGKLKVANILEKILEEYHQQQPPNVPNAVASWLNIAVHGILEHVEESLYELNESGEEITRSTIESLIESTTELSLNNEEYHIMQAVIYMAKEEASIEDLLEEYNE